MSFLTGRRKSRETIGVAGVLALVISPLVVAASAGPAAADDPAPDVVVSTDFADASWQDAWQQSGGPSLSLADDGGNQVLQVANRAADYEGIESKPAAVPFEEGVAYSFSARVKLAEDAGGPVEMRAVRKVNTPDGPQEADYAWIGNTSVDTEWTDIVGTFSIPEGADAPTAAVFFGTANNATATPYTYFIDDILITKPASGPATLLSSDFEGDDVAPWTPRGPVTLSIADEGHESAQSMLVSGRDGGWHGPQTAVGSLITEGTYQISGWVKLPAGSADPENPVEINLGMQQPGASNEYPWVGSRVAVGDEEWVLLSGSYTVDPATPPSNLYIESSDPTADFLVDDVVVLGPPSDAWTPTPDPDFVPGGAVGASASPINAARGSGDVAALTFDDGPNGATTERLLDFLGVNDIEATFCVIGQNIEAPGGAEVLQRIVADGHTLCNHSTSYADMGAMTHDQVEDDLKTNLQIIRDALGDPTAQVPYFRAPNGSFGVTGEVAAALGMQPLGLGNMIADWDNPQPSVEVLEDNLRNAIQPGAVVLVHDGGGDRENGVTAVENVIPEFLADGWTFALPRGGAPVAAYTQTFDFEDGTLQGWVARAVAEGAATVDVTDAEAHDGSTYAAIVTDRVHQGQGIGYQISDVFQAGVTYDITSWIKFADGQTPGDVWLSLAQTTGETTSYGTVAQFTGLSAGDWVQVEASLTMPIVDSALLYFETAYDAGNPGNTSTFLVDDVVFTARVPGDIQDLTPLKDTVSFPMGVAIDSRETLGAPSELLLKHFNQITPENHMKPEAFYSATGEFQVHPQAIEMMDFAQANGLGVYGHVLVWHSQTPDWFYQDEEGEFLTDSEADKQIMRDRMRTHIFDVAGAFAELYGPYGSDTNPFVAWDVINEVVDDSSNYADGLRRSRWYQILGEEFIQLSFRYADEAFNDVYAAEDADHPITLYINDYNTEQNGKQDRYHALVERLLAADVPIDGVGHQFHVSVAQPTSTLEAAIQRFQGMGLRQVVTELDVTLLTNNEAQIVEQGHYYKRAFDIFRNYADELGAVTVWGLTDGRSWRSASQPLLFDDSLQAKPAFYGAAGGEGLPPLIRAANVFAADISSATTPPGDEEWDKLRLHEIGADAGFQLRWSPGQLTAYVEVADATPSPYDAIELEYGDQTVTIARDGSGDVDGVVVETAGGYAAVVDLPFASPPAQNSTLAFDVRVTDDDTTEGWNSLGELGVLSLIEELSYVEVPETINEPIIDGEIERDWYAANVVKTEKVVEGTAGAKAEVRTLWKGETLYVLMDVTDPVVDTSHSDPWAQDSIELYVDGGNFKAGGFRYDDTQIRINADNVVSFGTGDETFQANRVESATARTATGYVVEVAIDLLSYSGLGTFHGLDFQVNDGAPASNRTAIHNWADPTGTGYQSTTRWGVGQLVEPQEIVDPGEPGDPDEVAPTITRQPKSVTGKAGKIVTLTAAASGTPQPSVQWHKRAAGSSTWKAIAGATSTSLKVKNTKGASGSHYRAVFTNTAGSVTTNAAKVTVKPVKPKVTKHPKSAKNVKVGKKLTLTAKATGAYPQAKVRWEQRKPGSKKWTKIKGSSSAKLKLVASHKTDGVRYRAVFWNKAGTVRTKAAKVTVRDSRPVFVKQPKHATTKGKVATFTAVVAANPRAKLQWFAKAPGARTWTAVKGAKGTTLKVRAAKARSGTRYVLIATNAEGWTSSKMVRLTVKR